MATIVKKNAVVRKPGHLYYVDGEGNICSSPMKRKKSAAKKKAPAKKKAAKKRK